MIRHLITCEYPPQVGGVADHTILLARGLASTGCRVEIWCPVAAGRDAPAPDVPGVSVHRAIAHFGPSQLVRLGARLDAWPAPRRLLVQWVPHGYGWRSLNVPFCAWLWWRARVRRDSVEIMVHEPFLAFGEGAWRQALAAAGHRVMTAVLLHAAERVFVSIPAWRESWRPYALGRQPEFVWVPVPSSIPVVGEQADRDLRKRYASTGRLVGHFGTYGGAVSRLLEPVVIQLVERRSDVHVLLIGRHSGEFRTALLARQPGLASRVHATGELEAPQVSRHLRICDAMVQPYPDGVSSRRTTAMAALAHGLPLVTTSGRLSEPLWHDSGAVVLVPPDRIDQWMQAVEAVLDDDEQAIRLGREARMLYERRFSIEPFVRHLTGAPARVAPDHA